jgi:hypothetical protein
LVKFAMFVGACQHAGELTENIVLTFENDASGALGSRDHSIARFESRRTQGGDRNRHLMFGADAGGSRAA